MPVASTSTSDRDSIAHAFALVQATVGAGATALFCSFAYGACAEQGKFWELAVAYHLTWAGVAALWALLQAGMVRATTGSRSPGRGLLLCVGLVGVGPLCLAVPSVLGGVLWPPLLLVGSLVLAVVTLVQLALVPEPPRRQGR